MTSPEPATPDAAARLVTASRFADPDAAFAALVAAHQGLDAEASAALDARLVLLLANHIGEPAVLDEAIRLARETLPGKS